MPAQAAKLDRVAKAARAAITGTLREPEALAEANLAQGFAVLKIRFHRGDWKKDILVPVAVRKRLSNRLELMVDCNQGWRMSCDSDAPWSRMRIFLPV